MRFKKLISSFLSAVMIFGNSLVPIMGLMEGWAVPTLRVALPALIGSILLTTKTAYARTIRNSLNHHNPSIPTIGDNPSDSEFENFRFFEVSFQPLSGIVVENENHDLAQAIHQLMSKTANPDTDPLETFVVQHPSSRWALAAELNRGFILYHAGYFSKALEAFNKAYELGKGETTLLKTKGLADRALAEAVRMNCRVGRMDAIKLLLPQLAARHPIGISARYCETAYSALWTMKNKPGKAFFCGPYALQSILKFQNSKKAYSSIIEDAQSPQTGYSLDQVWEMSEALGMDLQMAKRSPGAKVLLPAVANWKLNHYAALVEEKNGLIHSIDPTFGNQTWLTEKALDEESSGYFLVPAGALPEGWSVVGAEEATQVFGKGFVNTLQFGPPAPPTSCPPGMPVPSMDLFYVSAELNDIPIGYHPPVGPDVFMHLTFNSSNIVQPIASNLGINWNFNWQGYVQGALNTPPPQSSPSIIGYTLFNPGGGQENITMGGYTQFTHSLITDAGVGPFDVLNDPEFITQTLPDGSSQVYGWPVMAYGAVNYLLSQVIDPKGNVVNLAYDNQNRLSTITDAVGQVTTFSYNNPSDQNLITQIADPFGRTAVFSYDNIGNLVSMTDEIGMTSTIAYNVISGPSVDNQYVSGQVVTGDAISSLTTPYGTTTFDFSGSDLANNIRSIVITDPLQQKEQALFNQNLSPPDGTNPSTPNGTIGGDSFNNDRDTYYWNKKAMADDPGEPASAKIYHWLHTPESQQSAVIESIKSPNESRVWYVYPGQTQQIIEPIDDMPDMPIVATRFVNSTGTQQSQEYQYQYNGFGHVTNYTDPAGRTFTYTYAANNIDLLNVQDSNNETLASYTYDNQHDALTYTDASGKTSHYGYNNAGQMTSASAPLGETTTYNYDSNGHLISMVPPQSGGTVTYTYDLNSRVRTQTDAAHGTMTYTYDNLDRIKLTSYSDGTHEAYAYTNLDLTSYVDRQTRNTTYTYDAERRMISMTDPKTQTTQYGWCGCGSLASVTDPSGNQTTWSRDFEGRVTQKTYSDGSSLSYTWDQNGSQLLNVQDGRKELTKYTYDLDNELSTVVYDGAVTGTSNVNFSYDPTLPRLTSMSDGTGTTSYSYYAIGSTGGGHVQTVVSPVGTTTANIGYVYDADGRTTQRSIDSNGESYSYTNDELTNVTNPLGAFGYSYDPTTSNLNQITYPNGQKTTMAYYAPSNPLGAGRLQTLTNTGAGSTSGQTLSNFNYSYTQAGDINTWTQQLDNTPTDSHTYTMGYDKDSELTSATLTSGTSGFDGLTVNKGVTFGYDASGNRTSEQTSTYTHSFGKNNLNQLTNITPNPIPVQGSTGSASAVTVNGQAVTEDANNNFSTTIPSVAGNSTPLAIQSVASNGTETTQNNRVLNTQPFSYDANGNLIQDNKYSYTWDAENRLVQVTFNNPQPTSKTDTVQMTYDGVGRRVSITELHGTTTLTAKSFVWCGQDLCQERDSTGHTVSKQFFTQGEQVNGTNYYYTCDHLGSIRQMTDSNGVVHANYDYDAFGRQTKLSGDLDSDFGYTGFYVEKTLCLDLTWFRAYDSEKGRWLNRDPLGEDAGVNLYQYVLNSTLNMIDPLGLDAVVSPTPTNFPPRPINPQPTFPPNIVPPTSIKVPPSSRGPKRSQPTPAQPSPVVQPGPTVQPSLPKPTPTECPSRP